MDLTKLPSTALQIIYLTILADINLTNASSEAGKTWSQALDLVEESKDYEQLHWGRSVEHPEYVQLHIVRSSLSAHKTYLDSSSYKSFLKVLRPLLKSPDSDPAVRHIATLTTYTSKPTTPFRAPVTGTAVYLSTTSAWHEGSWPCWTHVVRHVKGCTGIVGGKVLEPVDITDKTSFAGLSSKDSQNAQHDQVENSYLVYVGWESIEDHSDYHHTKHFRDHSVILQIGNSGWREYGHIKFEGWRDQGNKGHKSKL